MDKKMFVSGTTMEHYWNKAKDELDSENFSTCVEMMTIKQFMNDDSYDIDAMNYMKFKAQERYEDCLCNKLVIDLSMKVLAIIHEVKTPTDLEMDYKEYLEDICKAIRENLK